MLLELLKSPFKGSENGVFNAVRVALPLFACLAMLSFAGCEGPVLDGPASTGSEAGIGVSASSASVNLALMNDPFTATHLGILADGYMYYGTFYDQYGDVCHDYYMFDTTNGNYFIYDDSTDTPDPGRIVSGEIQYIHHFGDNVSVTITGPSQTPVTFTGSAGVMIIELDHAIDDSEWVYTGSGNFTANYYYGGQPVPEEDGILVSVQNVGALNSGTLTSAQNGEDPLYPLTSVQIGIAAALDPDSDPNEPEYGTPCFETLADAITAFDSVTSLEFYISEPAEYLITSY
jgi:hypothetical protein